MKRWLAGLASVRAALAIAGGWLTLSLLIISEPSPNLLLLVLELYLVLGLLAYWLVLLAPNAYRAIKEFHLSGVLASAGYLLPLPMAVAILGFAFLYDLPLKGRLELSEDALVARASQVDSEYPDYEFARFIGLFRVQSLYKWDGCTIFVMDSFGPEDVGGRAYCTGRLPCAPTVEMDHIKGRWWRWNYWHTNERC